MLTEEINRFWYRKELQRNKLSAIHKMILRVQNCDLCTGLCIQKPGGVQFKLQVLI